jgi:hypothetical protein
MAYIYEHIRTRGYEPLYFEEHYIYLEARSVMFMHTPFNPSREELRQAIKCALQSERLSPSAMNTVEVRYYADGKLEVEAREIIYKEFSLRALHPEVYLCRASGETILTNTSAKEALIEFNHTSNEGVALWANEQDEVLAIDGLPVIAVFEEEVRFSHVGDSVEFELAYDAIVKMGRNATRGAIHLGELHDVKELLYIGYEGVGAVLRYQSTRYMDITAEKLAATIAESERG